MSLDLTQFRAARKRFADGYRVAVMERAASLGNTLADAIGDRTPVDTGAAKDSWNASVGHADLRIRDRQAGYYNPLGEPDGERIPEIPGVAPWGAEIHVSNNVPYINDLNAGSSRQAPAGFVELTLAEVAAGVLGEGDEK